VKRPETVASKDATVSGRFREVWGRQSAFFSDEDSTSGTGQTILIFKHEQDSTHSSLSPLSKMRVFKKYFLPYIVSLGEREAQTRLRV